MANDGLPNPAVWYKKTKSQKEDHSKDNLSSVNGGHREKVLGSSWYLHTSTNIHTSYTAAIARK